jgi:hypothetical protein
MTENCKSDDPDVTDERRVSSALAALRAACRDAAHGRSGWPVGAATALADVVAGRAAPSARAGRIAVAAERVRAAVEAADPDAMTAAVDRLETLVETHARVPDPAVRATAPDPPGKLAG